MVHGSTKQSTWYYLIDAIRGFALLNMLFFHFFYDVFVIFGQDTGWYHYSAVRVWQQFICITFLVISGISWHFSKNNLKRGILLNLYGLLITAVTLLVMPSQTVWFGILNCIGCATLLMIPLHKLLNTLIPRFASYKVLISASGLFFSLFLFCFTKDMTDGYLRIMECRLDLPKWLYTFRPMTILGFPHPSFWSSDYFPIFPWFFLFLAGYFCWTLIGCFPHLRDAFRAEIPLLSRIGKKTIWVYLLHQPLLYGIAYFLVQIVGLKFV